MTWNEIAANWNRGSAVESRPRPMLEPEPVFALLRDVCEPYGRGLRYFAVPAVDFRLDGDQVLAPGDLLPGPNDPGLAAYAERLTRRGGRWRLRVVEPLFTDYRLWAAVRDHIEPLWSKVGMPVLSVASELLLAHDTELCRAETGHLGLGFVVSGRVRLTEDGTDRELAPGDAVRLSAGSAAALHAAGTALVLRLRVNVDRRAAVADAVGLFTRVIAAEAAEAGETVPELAFPPPTRNGELVRPDPPGEPAGRDGAAVTAYAPHHADRRAEVERLARTWWAGRASAAGLDPVPDPAQPPPLEPGQRVRLAVPVLVAPDAVGDRQLWAVNGMAFTVAGPVPARVLHRLRDEDGVEVAELCRDEDGDDNGAEVLLDRLHSLRAIEIAEETS